jgi:hypothetical protein
MAKAVDLAPQGFAAIESPSTWREMRYPLGGIASAFESTVSRVHVPASRSGCDVAAHRAHLRAQRESAANSDPSLNTLRTSSMLIWSTTRARDGPTGVLARELPSTAARLARPP